MNQDIVLDFLRKNKYTEFKIVDITKSVFNKENIDRFSLEYTSVSRILGRLRNQKRVKGRFEYPYTYYTYNVHI